MSDWSCPSPRPAGERILLGHGAGGRLSDALVRQLFLPRFDPDRSEPLTDAAIVEVNGVRLAFTTDAFVVQPRSFAGADIGSLAVNGTVNDLAVMGAAPAALSAAFIVEEGFGIDELASLADSMAAAASCAGVRLVTGDTKVVERGAADGLFIVTSGIGVVADGLVLDPRNICPGDVVIASGPVGSHGVAVLSRRAGIDFDADVASDSAPMAGPIATLLEVADVRCLRDATRGGLATVVCELADAAGVGITIDEERVPVLDPVRAACAALGLDALYVANEGVVVAVVAPDDAETAVAALHRHASCSSAAVVGTVGETPGSWLRTPLGTTRPLMMLTGEQLPRIC